MPGPRRHSAYYQSEDERIRCTRIRDRWHLIRPRFAGQDSGRFATRREAVEEGMRRLGEDPADGLPRMVLDMAKYVLPDAVFAEIVRVGETEGWRLQYALFGSVDDPEAAAAFDALRAERFPTRFAAGVALGDWLERWGPDAGVYDIDA